MGSASCTVICTCNRTALEVAKAFSAPWKAISLSQASALSLHPPRAAEVPRTHFCY